ncbi:G-type lectin S-receptor-like serine/threonine-protein kinase [Heracleum sosnowskyi]|uniref:Receptor-like serine/threonine-protein kinase n=1 Tax=Heracleum sosnowskyi TaxID=360622 RepID=A0AAD8IT64_9APIA|nr:G-type lectin S-receptor-like serine/threonine-protein kinase [Heracleum sosnowskyi]
MTGTLAQGIFILSTSSFFIVNSSAGDILSPNQTIKIGETIVSAGGVYELGFFNLGSSKNQYLSIRYKKAGGVIAWIANRDTPLTDASAALTLSNEGTLKLLNGTNTIIWSSNSTKSSKNPVAQLLDTGNLVIRTDDNADQGDFLWQSFDFPDNAFLPGMKIGKNLATGLVWSLNSWKSDNDPSPGNFQVKLDIRGYPQLFVYNGSARYIRVGPWNGVTFSGFPTAVPVNIYVDEFRFKEEEIYYKYELFSYSLLIRLIIVPDGRAIRYTWTDQSNKWEPATFIQADYCDGYARCGAYGTCNLNSFCKCLDGFQPQNLEAWRGLNFSEGCVRATELICSDRDDFVPYSTKKLPDTQRSVYNLSMNLEDCRKKCLENCSCTAYANTNITGKGSGCLLWFGGLIDIRDQEQSEHVFYVRAVSSGPGSGARRIVLMVLLPIILILTVVLGFYLWCVSKYRKRNREGELIEGEIDNEGKDLPLFDFRTIANATNNFSNNNKLGEGGFGPVYKGILEDGQEIAVKRRSARSTQGVEEFKNEVSCIAKLQHRNLVRLLGWSTEEGERMLVYEYMPNKSLNYFIFGDTKERASLDWPQRYNIINGIAKGLLYLHEDSRLRVIHRDLKASNILLDYKMNPKISDFGMARSFGDTETEAKTARVVGTFGYMSPEYAIEGAFSVKSDVYSFGVLMIEIVSGKKSRFFDHPSHNLNLMGHAWMSYREDRLLELIDESILESIDQHEVFRVILIGLLCVQQYPEDRPNMSSVVRMLTSNNPLPHPKQPGFFTERKLVEEYNLSGNEADALYNLVHSSSSNQTVTVVEPR